MAAELETAFPDRSFGQEEVPEGTCTFEDLIALLGTAFAYSGDDSITLSANPIVAIREALRRPVTIVIDNFHHCFDADTDAPDSEVRKLIERLSRLRNTPGRLLLVTSATVGSWAVAAKKFTLPPFNEDEGVAALRRMLGELKCSQAVSRARETDVVRWLAGNPRALQILAVCLQNSLLDELIGSAPDAWELRNRSVSPALVKELEAHFLHRIIDRLDERAKDTLKRLSVLRRSFSGDAVRIIVGDSEEIAGARKKLSNAFLIEWKSTNYVSLNPVARELSLHALLWTQSESRRAHAAAGAYYARAFQARRVFLAARGADFIEARYHLVMAQDIGTLANVCRSYSLALDRTYAARMRIPIDPEQRDELIMIIRAVLDETSPSWRLHLYLAMLLLKRDGEGDAAEALEHTTRATASVNSTQAAWIAHLRLVKRLKGDVAAFNTAKHALGVLDIDEASAVYIVAGHLAIANSTWRDETIGLLKDGIAKVPAQYGQFSLYVEAARLLSASGQPEAAVELLKDGIAKVPAQYSQFSLYQEAARLLSASGQPEAAVELLKDGIAKVPAQYGLSSLYVEAARLLSASGQPEAAVELLKDGIAKVPAQYSQFSLYQEAARLLSASGQPEAAVELLKDGIAKVPAQYGQFSLYVEAARLLSASGQPEAAVELLKDGIAKVPAQHNQFSLYQEAARLLSASGQPEAAVELLKDGIAKVPAQYGLSSLYVEAARLLSASGQPEAAVELLKDGIAKVPAQHNQFSLYQEAARLLSASGQPEAAVELLKDGIAKVPAQHSLSSLYVEAARLLSASGQPEAAVELLKDGIARLPAQYWSPGIRSELWNLLAQRGIDVNLTAVVESLEPFDGTDYDESLLEAVVLGTARRGEAENLERLQHLLTDLGHTSSTLLARVILAEMEGRWEEAANLALEGSQLLPRPRILIMHAALGWALAGDQDQVTQLISRLTSDRSRSVVSWLKMLSTELLIDVPPNDRSLDSASANVSVEDPFNRSLSKWRESLDGRNYGPGLFFPIIPAELDGDLH